MSTPHRIEFHARPDLIDRLPHPYPASRAIPDWFKTMSPGADDPQFATVKRCPPFLEAMTAGYIIPFPADITISFTSDRIDVQVDGYATPMVEFHPQHQFPGAPFPPVPVVKFINPWIIKTPPGHSTLFLPPQNRFESPFLALSGLVETDTLYQPVHIPTLCFLKPNQSSRLLKGTPMVQVIPISRNAWHATTQPWDQPAFDTQRKTAEQSPHFYKEQLWQKKMYG